MANTKFDSKSFNAEAFKYMVGRVPNLKLNELRKSKALGGNPDIAAAFANQNGTAYARIAMRGLLDGDVQNYDGQTDIVASSTKTYEQGVVVVGRAKAWVERDFSYDITGGVDFMGNVAEQVAEYFEGVDQDTLLAILTGIFGMSTNAKDVEFVQKHTFDITGESDEASKVGATTLNSAINKACGANKKKFTICIMHSDVATNLENLKLLNYYKYTDAEGIERDLVFGSWNGRAVLIDDAMPLVKQITTQEVKGTSTITINTAATAGDKVQIDGTVYTCHATSTSWANKTFAVKTDAASQAAELVKLLKQQYAGIFTATATGAAITLTQVVGGTGDTPTVQVDAEAETMVATAADGTTGVAEEDVTTYITYVLGTGSISYENLGAKVPFEMARNAAKNGGEDTLYTRQRKAFAPYGLSYEKTNQASTSPTDLELADGSNWQLVHSGEVDVNERTYINHKAIPICRIISLG